MRKEGIAHREARTAEKLSQSNNIELIEHEIRLSAFPELTQEFCNGPDGERN